MSNKAKENKWSWAHSHGTIYGLEEAAAVLEVLANEAPTDGPKAREFEEKFAQYVGAKHALCVSSCVAAMHLASIAAGIGPGDEVLVPAITFQATANVPSFQGAKVRFVDVDRRTFNMDPHRIKENITLRTKAIFPVHMCGQPCDMDSIMRIARENNLVVIEDAAHAVGAEYKGRKIGEIGDFTAFSFQQTKNMSTLGEGGMVTTNSDEYAEIMRSYYAHGYTPDSKIPEAPHEPPSRPWCSYPGLNYRMTDVQATVGIIQLSKLDNFIDRRGRLAHYLSVKLKSIRGITVPCEGESVRHAFHLYNILIDPDALGMDRNTFLERLSKEAGIRAITQYYPTVYLLEYYLDQAHQKEECPIAEDISKRVVTLPLSPRFTQDDMDYLADAIRNIIESEEPHGRAVGH